jgi:Domain of unknown function (DUF1990)
MHRIELIEGSADTPPPLPQEVKHEGIQRIQDGVGSLFHRRYAIAIGQANLSAEQIIDRISNDPNITAPTEFARFIKLTGNLHGMSAGDEFIVRMPGPWDGPVRVVETTATSFRFATLQGHLEAGQIEFRARDEANLVFEIESWARSGDRLSALLFDTLRMAKEVQVHMWVSVLERVARLAGRRTGPISIETRRVDSQ